MKRIILLVIAPGLLWFSTVAGGASETYSTYCTGLSSPDSTINIKTAQFASLKDPICGMDIRVHLSDTATYGGKLYGFCAAGCKREFLKRMTHKRIK